MKSSIFIKLLGAAFLLIAVTLVAVDFTLTGYAGRKQLERVEDRLRAESELLASEIPNSAGQPLRAWVNHKAGQSRAQITVIDADGNVVADSVEKSPENQASFPEVKTALAGAAGNAVHERNSNATDKFSYVAKPVTLSGKPAVLRLGAPLQSQDTATAELRRRILTISLAGAIFALIIAYAVSRSLSRRVSGLKKMAETLLDASYPQTTSDANDELGALEQSLNVMSARFRELVDGLSLESARREAILSSMAEGVLAVDNGLHVTFCNDSFARLIGFKGRVPRGVTLLEVVRDPGLLQVLTRVARSGELVKQRLQLLPASGRSFEVYATPLATGSGRGAIAVLHDTTDLERLEQVRKDFVANVSHELRTPLAAIAGYAETLLDGALNDPDNNRRFVEVIQSSAIRLNSIASDLLVLSELEAGINPGEPGRISVRSALEDALGTVEAEARTRGVKVVRGNIQDAEVMGSKIRLEQALLNLLMNAVKFNRPGGEVRADAGRTPEGSVFIKISDTGVGIPFEDLPRIFERFYRVDKARSRQVGGTGLGLSIVKHVVERMDGKVMVESQLGKGSVFTVVLPAS